MLVAVFSAMALLAPPDSQIAPACRAVCARAMAALGDCAPDSPRTCDPFLNAGDQLLGQPDCADIGFWKCDDGHGFIHRWFDTLSRLSDARPATPVDRRRALRALALLGDSGGVLDGEWGERWGDAVSYARKLSGEGVLDEAELWRKRLSSAPPRTARASSALPPQGRHRYEPGNAVDGKEGTAWCSAHRASGIGAWIEISVQPGALPFGAISMIPGHGRDEGSFRRNNRILRVRAAACAAPDQGGVYDLRFLDSPSDEDALTDVERRPYSFPVPRSGCTRITIVEIAPGPDDDTCISEVVPFE